MSYQFLVHHRGDSVGIAIEEIQGGQVASGICLDESGERIETEALETIRFGHKIALTPIEEGTELIEYGEHIGVATRPIRPGQHVHTHNLRSTRWQPR